MGELLKLSVFIIRSECNVVSQTGCRCAVSQRNVAVSYAANRHLLDRHGFAICFVCVCALANRRLHLNGLTSNCNYTRNLDARQWTLAGGRVTGYWEASVSEWSYLAADARRSAWLGHVGLIPMFGYKSAGGASQWLFEAGVGLTLTTSLYETDGKRFSTSFNFGDHLAAGPNFGQHGEHDVSMRLQHFSNGEIKYPNPGEDFTQLRCAYRFFLSCFQQSHGPTRWRQGLPGMNPTVNIYPASTRA